MSCSRSVGRPVRIIWTFGGSDLTDHPAGIPDSERPRRNIFGDDASGSNDTVVSDGHSRQYTDFCPDPYIVTDSYRMCIFKAFVPLFHIKRMAGRVKSAVRSYEYIVSEPDRCPIQNDAVDIGKEILPDFDIIAIVAVEGLFYLEILPGPAEQPSYEFCPRGHI